MIGDVFEAVFNDISSVEALMDDQVCAVILEPVQGGERHHSRRSGVFKGREEAL